MIETVTERQNGHADNGVQRFGAVVRHGQCAGHDTETEPAHRAGHGVAMLEDAPAKRDRSHDHRQAEANLMNPGRTQHSARAGDQCQQHGGRQAMDEAKPGQADGHPVQPVGGNRKRRHASRI